jgi:hypothetical protein
MMTCVIPGGSDEGSGGDGSLTADRNHAGIGLGTASQLTGLFESGAVYAGGQLAGRAHRSDQMQLFQQIKQFVDNLPAGERVAVFTRAGSVTIELASFTDDHATRRRDGLTLYDRHIRGTARHY